MSDNDHEDENLPEPDGHHSQDKPDNSGGISGDLDSVIDNGERFDFVLRYYLRDEAVGVDRIKDKASAPAALSEARVDGYDEIRWTRVEPGTDVPQPDGAGALPQASSIRAVEMPWREPGLFGAVVERLRSRWTNPFFPHEGE